MIGRDRKILRNDIREINELNNEELLYMFGFFLEAFINSIFTFGLDHRVTDDAFEIFSEFRDIIKEEKRLNKEILSESIRIDADECYKLLEQLQELNEQTVLYYYNAFYDILDACSTKCPDRATHFKRNFKTLTETEEYRDILISLTISLHDVKESLNYEYEFWDFIDDKTIIVDSKIQLHLCGVRESDNEIQIVVPYIINRETADLNMKIFSTAYQMFKQKKFVKRIKSL